ncbi:hypothetical protein M8994_07405 [Brucella sp. 21LCYQ03]|nr:hypothetical protein [Brucella sp. 21LCYQ03]
MKTILALGLATIFFYPTTIYAATDAEVVTEMATKCWEIPENKDIKSASATFELTYNAEGELSRIVAI